MNQSHPSENKKKIPVIWVITEGLAGTENQCLGIVEALESKMPIRAEIKKISLTSPWKYLSPWLGVECAGSFTPPPTPPWPDILIASGRKSIAASRYIKKQSGGNTFTVQIQDPRINPASFDLVAVPAHDPTRGQNVIVTTATPNRITPEKLDRAKAEWDHVFGKLPAPRIAVLIGGSTKKSKATERALDKLAATLEDMALKYSLMITTSRRTGDKATQKLNDRLAKYNNVFFWNGKGANPYMGMLACADYIAATNDSTSMLSEAASTGKPVYSLPLVELSGRQQKLLSNLKTHGAVRNWNGTAGNWAYEPLRDAGHVANAIIKTCGLFQE